MVDWSDPGESEVAPFAIQPTHRVCPTREYSGDAHAAAKELVFFSQKHVSTKIPKFENKMCHEWKHDEQTHWQIAYDRPGQEYHKKKTFFLLLIASRFDEGGLQASSARHKIPDIKATSFIRL